ncbi:MAG: HEAT repeat domain-containing protein [Planctomycetota bacterium]|nr:HEAT repeat domain-containing protein [Planctomycetota bacterium]
MIRPFLAILIGFVLLAAGDSELVAEFRRYYGKDKSPVQRREAVLNLADENSLEATQVLLEVFEDDEYLVRRAAIDVVGDYRDEVSARWLLDEVLLDRKRSRNKELVACTAEALGGMQHTFASDALVDLLGHRDLGVRLGALAGLGSLGGSKVVSPIVALATDPGTEDAVVIACLNALGQIGDGSGGEPAVLVALQHSSKQVRLKAVASVEELHLKAGVRPLIMIMGDDPDPRVSEDAYEVLRAITLRKFEDDMDRWLAWWDRNEKSFEMPDLEKVAAALKTIAEEGTRYNAGAKSFENIQTKSDNIIFVIDVSNSMSEPFGDPERLKRSGREYKSLQRLEIVKEELINTIQTLSESTNFNVVAYATGVDVWKKKAARASILNRNNAARWVEGLRPRGGAAASFRERMGHASGVSDEGRTNTYLALMTAFGEDVDQRKPNAFVTKITDPVDTIFFLTDGEPTVGKTVDMVEIREEVARVNAFRGVQIHVIYVGAFGGKDFKQLADQNGGVFISIGG